MNIEYNHDKFAQMLKDKYMEAFGKSPSTAANNVIECIDDVCMEEYWKENLEVAHKTIGKMEHEESIINDQLSELESMQDDYGIKDQRVLDALRVYQTIVNMNFETPQQKLQNIQNASYFIWALFAYDSDGKSSFMNGFCKDKISNVKEESSFGSGFEPKRY